MEDHEVYIEQYSKVTQSIIRTYVHIYLFVHFTFFLLLFCGTGPSDIRREKSIIVFLTQSKSILLSTGGVLTWL